MPLRRSFAARDECLYVTSEISPRENPLPVLPRLLDALCIALFLLSFVIHVGGGFRLRIGDVRVSFLSWLPVLVIGLVLLIARHWRWPSPSVLGRAARIYRRLSSSTAWQDTWGIFVATRAGVLLVGLLAVYTIGFPDDRTRFRVSENEVLNLPVRWDAGWYLNITTGGYRWNPDRDS